MDKNGGKSGNFAWGEIFALGRKNPKVVERDPSGNFAWGEISAPGAKKLRLGRKSAVTTVS
ncbi:hypothetical protein A2U01_0070745 [Trifolium medium]|uniref:Uncharacterized protein n=1 Tax=Trifolium medium TaxID=97028 RepID=A0A392SKV2_9FABA|nr:hypothetical protein [Trifolium medium]